MLVVAVVDERVVNGIVVGVAVVLVVDVVVACSGSSWTSASPPLASSSFESRWDGQSHLDSNPGNLIAVVGVPVGAVVDVLVVTGAVTRVVAVVVLVLVVTGKRVVVLPVNVGGGNVVILVAVGVDEAPFVSNFCMGACSSVSNFSMGAFCSVSNFSMGASPSWSSWYWPRARSGRTP